MLRCASGISPKRSWPPACSRSAPRARPRRAASRRTGLEQRMRSFSVVHRVRSAGALRVGELLPMAATRAALPAASSPAAAVLDLELALPTLELVQLLGEESMAGAAGRRVVDAVDRLVGHEVSVMCRSVARRRDERAVRMRTPWCTSYRSLSPRRIATVSSIVGSSTVTGMKRRSSAASFSMYLRYSSRVVAPTHFRSPRARAGLSMLAASTAPSEPPAPTSVWSSSMNRTTSPSASLISSRTAFSRSSNSPVLGAGSRAPCPGPSRACPSARRGRPRRRYGWRGPPRSRSCRPPARR